VFVPNDVELERVRAELLQLLSTVGKHRLTARDSDKTRSPSTREAAVYDGLAAAEARLFEAFLVFPQVAKLPA